MKKEEYLQIFINALEPLSQQERQQLRDYYEEMICDGLEQGLTEEECVAQFGDPLEAAAQFREENGGENTSQAPESKIVPTFPPSDGFHTLNLTAEDTRVVVEPRQQPDFRIEFTPDPERDLVESEERDGVWYFRHKIKKRPFRNFFGFFRQNDAVITVQVPVSFSGNLLIHTSNSKIFYHSLPELPQVTLTTSNARIDVENSGAQKLTCKTSNASIFLTGLRAQAGSSLEAITSNGKIQGEGLRFDQIFCKTCNSSFSVSQADCESLELHTSNGKIEARDCAVSGLLSLTSSNASLIGEQLRAGKMTFTTSNGGLRVQDLSSDHIALRTSNASITGTIRGDMREYATEAKTSNGSCNIPNLHYPEQTKDFSAITSNGKIQIEFQP